MQFDHGTEINLKRYGQESPPPYNLNLVTAPVYLFWGQNDQLATPDVPYFRLLCDRLICEALTLASQKII